jgi:phosphate transport system substrate-binding protein
MLKEVMKGREITKPLRDEYAAYMGEMVRGVASYRDTDESIGYSFRFFAKNMVEINLSAPPGWIRTERAYKPSRGTVKLLRINGIEPSEENIRSGTYPLTVDIYAVTAGTKNPRVSELIDWILSPSGQELVERSGYVGVNMTSAQHEAQPAN